MKKMIGFGDKRTSGIVAKIADEEVAHVAVGVYWFIAVCQKMGRVPCSAFKGINLILINEVHYKFLSSVWI